MSYFQALILGVVQGITEFLPISSSAHLVITPIFFGWELPENQVFLFDVLVQLGTLVAVILYFRGELIAICKDVFSGILARDFYSQPNARLGWNIVLASIPAGLAGLFLEDLVEMAFHNPISTSIFLFCTAAILLGADHIGRGDRRIEEVTWMDAIWIGFTQALAIFPGISRSGATISGGMVRNLGRKAAARFSFLMSVPIMLAAGFLSVTKLFLMADISDFLPILLIGFITSAIVGYLAIHWLLNFLTRHSLKTFAFYCVGLGIITIIVTYVS
jgi:undecaprenyl-diphosphatase